MSGPGWREMALAVASAAVTYALAEVGATCYVELTHHGVAALVYEARGDAPAFTFDPVLGYRTATRAVRGAYLGSDGLVVWRFTQRANRYGVQGADDYDLRRHDPGPLRVIVFGDSFTAAPFLETNWPARAQAECAARGKPIRLLNVAVDGVGLANWWSILTRWVAPSFDADAVLFAIFEDDLDRRFAYRKQGPGPPGTAGAVLLGRAAGWDPRTYPRNEREAGVSGWAWMFLLRPTEFERALQGRWSAPRARQAPGLFFASRVKRLVRRPPRTSAARFEDRQRALIFEMRQAIEARGWRALVVRVTLERDGSQPDGGRAARFASLLDARFVNGDRAFAGLSPEQIQELWAGPDGHWNQAGSDRFAAFMALELERYTGTPGAPE